jgi:multiple sugar transport system substrate-binding protein
LQSNWGNIQSKVFAKRRSVLGLAAGTAITGVANASATNTPSLTIAAYPALDQIIKDALPKWKQRHPNVPVKVVSRQFVDHHTAMTTALSTSFYLPDVMALEVGYLGRFAQGGGLENLAASPYDVPRFKSRFAPFAFDQARGRNNSIVAVPTDLGPGTLLYRTDILQKASISEKNLTDSWESYVDSGIKIKATTGAYLLAHAREIKDILIRAGLKPGEGLYFDRDSQVLVNSPRFERAFELARRVRANRLDGRIAAWSNEWAEGFRSGALATQMTGAWLAGHLNNWLAPQTKGKWRASQLPEQSWAAYGGTFLAIARGSPAAHKLLAWEFIQMLTLERQQQLDAFKSQDAFPALLEAQDDPFFESPIEFLGGQKARLLWRDAVQKISAVQVHKQDAFADEVINTELDKVLDRGKSIKTALTDAQRILTKRALR